MAYIQKGTKAFRNANLALFAGAFSTYANLYMTQPILPALSKQFGVSPTIASLSLSLTTLTLAIAMLLTGSLSETWGRKPIMTFSMIAVGILSLAIGFAPNFESLLVLRVIQGVVFAGLPAIAMAYLAEEMEPSSLGAAMGLYISGNSIGGLSGRVIMGSMTDVFNWHIAMVSIGVVSILLAIAFYFLLPKSQHFIPQKLAFKPLFKSMMAHLKDRALLMLFALGFLLMGAFVTLYNYVGFQLIEPPYSLSQTVVGFIFLLYLVGTFSSTFMGKLADSHGRFSIILIAFSLMIAGALLTLNGWLIIKILGIALFTFGFFGGHSIASGWVGARATHDKAQASSLYLFFYYVGSSIGGTVGGLFFTGFGWSGVISMIMVFLLIGMLITIFLNRYTTN